MLEYFTFSRKIYSLLILLLVALSSLAQTTASTSAGDWNTSGNWSNGVPANGGTATISHDMIMDGHITVFNGHYTLTNTGSLTDPTGGTDYNLDIRGTGYLEVSGKIIVRGDLEVRNNGELILNGCDSIIVEGDADFSGDSKVTINACAALFVEGNLDLANFTEVTVNGNIIVDNEVITRNSSTIIGTGRLNSGGAVDIKNTSSIFGSTTDCGGPCQYGPGSALPIQLLSFFTKTDSKNSIIVCWETANEINNGFFTLEHSKDGYNFYEIDKIQGAGNSNTSLKYHYNFGESTERRNYFRLSQTDFDGNTETFPIIELENELNNSESDNRFEAQFFPNPGDGLELNVKIRHVKSNSVEVAIFNMEGVMVYSKTLFSDINNNDFILKLDKLGKAKLNNGVYYILITSGSMKSTLKYIVY